MIISLDRAFKTVHVSFYFIEKIEADAYVYRFLLAKYLTQYTKTFNTKDKFINALRSIYGAYISNQIFLLGDYHVLRFNLVFPNPLFINDLEVLKDLKTLLTELFFNREPFNKQIFNEVKRTAIEHINTATDRKYEYARDSLLKYTFSNHPYGKQLSGTLEEVKSITEDELYQYYQNYFLKNEIKIYATGDIKDELKEIINGLEIYETKKPLEVINVKLIEKTLSNHKDFLQMQQAMIFLAYSFDINRNSDLFLPAQIANIILGGYPDSKLYKIIREEMMLSYDVDSHFEFDKKYLFVFAGVNLEDKQLAFDAMIDIVNNFIFDGATKEELNQAKQFLKNQLIAGLDNQESVIPKIFNKEIFGVNDDFEETMRKIDEIKLDDIKTVLKQLKLKTTYILSGDKNEY